MASSSVSPGSAYWANIAVAVGGPFKSFFSFAGIHTAEVRTEFIRTVVNQGIDALPLHQQEDLLRWGTQARHLSGAPKDMNRRDLMEYAGRVFTLVGAGSLFARITRLYDSSSIEYVASAAGVGAWQAVVLAKEYEAVFLEKLFAWLEEKGHTPTLPEAAKER